MKKVLLEKTQANSTSFLKKYIITLGFVVLVCLIVLICILFIAWPCILVSKTDNLNWFWGYLEIIPLLALIFTGAWDYNDHVL